MQFGSPRTNLNARPARQPDCNSSAQNVKTMDAQAKLAKGTSHIGKPGVKVRGTALGTDMERN